MFHWCFPIFCFCLLFPSCFGFILLFFFFEVLEGRSIDYQFKPFPFSQCMHLLLWMSFIILPHKSGYVVCSYSFNLMFTLISLEISLWLLDYLHCVISKCFREFSVIFLLLIFYFDSVMFQEHTLFIILVLLNMLSFILWPRIWFILVYVPRALEKKFTLLSLVRISCTVGESLLVVGGVFYILADFPSSCSPVVDRVSSWVESSTLYLLY